MNSKVFRLSVTYFHDLNSADTGGGSWRIVKGIKVIQIGDNEVKLSLFTEHKVL